MSPRIRLWYFAVVLSVLFAGCAGRAPQEDVLRIYPLPPEEPRIAYISSYSGEAGFYDPTFFDSVFGKPLLPSLDKPYGVFADGDVIYVAMTTGGAVAVMDTKEKKVRYIGRTGMGKLELPVGIVGSPEGLLYVSDVKFAKVFIYDRQGNLKGAIGKKGDFSRPAGLAINRTQKRLFVVDTSMHEVQVFSLQGERQFRFGKRGSEKGQFNYPTNIAVDEKTGELYVADTMNFRVQVFDGQGKFLRQFGVVGDRPGNFARPKGVALDSEGHIYVIDSAFNNFQIMNREGAPLLFVGEAGRGPGTFLSPAGIYIDPNDRIYISDQLNNRVEVYQFLSDQWKKEHPEEYKKYLLQ